MTQSSWVLCHQQLTNLWLRLSGDDTVQLGSVSGRYCQVLQLHRDAGLHRLHVTGQLRVRRLRRQPALSHRQSQSQSQSTTSRHWPAQSQTSPWAAGPESQTESESESEYDFTSLASSESDISVGSRP